MCPAIRRRRGFTLTEILVVIVIIGVAAAVITPQLGTRDDLRAASAARLLTADLIWAQNRAILTQAMRYVRFDATTSPAGYAVLVSITPEVSETHPIQRTPYTVLAGAGGTAGLEAVSFTLASFDGRRILAFDELGTPHSYDPVTATTQPLTDGRVELRCGGFTLTVRIEPFTGEISVN